MKKEEKEEIRLGQREKMVHKVYLRSGRKQEKS